MQITNVLKSMLQLLSMLCFRYILRIFALSFDKSLLTITF